VIEKCKDRVLQSFNPNVLNPNSGWIYFGINEPVTFYKLVALLPDGSMVSIFDGKTTYNIGKWMENRHGAASWPPLYACYHGCVTVKQALQSKFPRRSKLLHAPRVLLECVAVGPAYFNSHDGFFAVSKLKPVRIVTNVDRTNPLDIHHVLNGVNRNDPEGSYLLNENLVGPVQISEL